MKIFDYIRERFRKKKIDTRVQCHLCKNLYPKEECYDMIFDRHISLWICSDCSEEEGNCTWEVSPQ